MNAKKSKRTEEVQKKVIDLTDRLEARIDEIDKQIRSSNAKVLEPKESSNFKQSGCAHL